MQKIRIFGVITVSSLMLSGCGIARMQAQNEQMAKYSACKHEHFVQHISCLHRIEDTDTVLVPNSTGLQTLIAYGDMLAEKVKAHTMTEAEANYAFDEKGHQLEAQEQEQTNSRMVAGAAVSEAWAANRPHTTNCTGFGNSVSCTGY